MFARRLLALVQEMRGRNGFHVALSRFIRDFPDGPRPSQSIASSGRSRHQFEPIAQNRLKIIGTEPCPDGRGFVTAGALDPADRQGSDPRDGPSPSGSPPRRHSTPSQSLNPSRGPPLADRSGVPIATEKKTTIFPRL